MHPKIPILITDDLIISLPRAAIQITATEGMRIAEHLIRKSTRRMVAEIATENQPRRRAGRARQ
jgi:hypothetical protein